MTKLFYFKVGTISESTRAGHKACSLKRAAEHNLRAGKQYLSSRSNIDASKSHLNQILYGPTTASEIVTSSLKGLSKECLANVTRKDFVQAGEIIFSPKRLPVHALLAFFKTCRAWALEVFGSEKILSAVIHRDQSEEHMHILISPVLENRLIGSALFRKSRLKVLQRSFEETVLVPLGLPTIKPKLTKLQRNELESQVVLALQMDGRASLDCCAKEAIKASIRKDPCIFFEAMKLEGFVFQSTLHDKTYLV